MAKFKVLTDSLSWIKDKAKRKGEIVTDKDYPDYKELVRRGFLEEVKEEPKKEASKKTATTQKTTQKTSAKTSSK